MRANGAAAIGAALFASAWLTAAAHAQTLLERSAEVRMQLDLAVSPAALKALLPDGWEPFVATSGPAKDCNVRLIFVDRVDINSPDGAPAGTEQMAYFAAPIKKTGSNVMDGQMVIDGITANAKNAPGPFKVYQAATGYRVERSTHAARGGSIENEDTWEFTGSDGEHLALHLTYERGVARKLAAETKFFSAADPKSYQVWKIDQGLDIMRNATVPVKDHVKSFEFRATGGRVAKLFDGRERVLSVDALHWYNRAVSSP
jgi:hypothetical protein